MSSGERMGREQSSLESDPRFLEIYEAARNMYWNAYDEAHNPNNGVYVDAATRARERALKALEIDNRARNTAVLAVGVMMRSAENGGTGVMPDIDVPDRAPKLQVLKAA